MFKNNSMMLPAIEKFTLFKDDTNNNRALKNSCRCLFGEPDAREIDELYELQEQIERERLINRWGFDPYTETIIKTHSRLITATITDNQRNRSNKIDMRIRKSNIIDNNNDNDIENFYPMFNDEDEHCFTKNNPINRQPLGTISSNRPNTMSVRKNLFAVNEQRSVKPYNRQLQITDFWRIRKSPKQVTIESKKIMPTTSSSSGIHQSNRKSPSSRRQLQY